MEVKNDMVDKRYEIKNVRIVPGSSLNPRWKNCMQVITTDKGEFIDNLPINSGHNWQQEIGKTVTAKVTTDKYNNKWLNWCECDDKAETIMPASVKEDLPSGYDINDNPQLKQAYDYIKQDIPVVFLTGGAGTGKSTFIKYLKNNLRADLGKNYVVLAPTGVAAINVGGQTIHSFFKFKTDVFDDKEIKKAYKNPALDYIDLIIIDEISMVHSWMLDHIDYALRLWCDENKPFGGKQMLFIGDCFQLPPVKNVEDEEKQKFYEQWESPFFFAAKVLGNFSDIGIKSIQLEKIYRQKDERFIHILNRIRQCKAGYEDDIQFLNEKCFIETRLGTQNVPEECLLLSTTNAKVDAFNAKKILSLKQSGKSVQIFEAFITGEFNLDHVLTPKLLELCVGAKIMITKNISSQNLVNGDMGKVLDFGGTGSSPNDYVDVEVKGQRHRITRETWQTLKYNWDEKSKTISQQEVGAFNQIPLKLGWAVTIHKSQGLTLDSVAIDAARAWDSGQVYVALSRARSLSGVLLCEKIPVSAVKTDGYVLEKYNELFSDEIGDCRAETKADHNVDLSNEGFTVDMEEEKNYVTIGGIDFDLYPKNGEDLQDLVRRTLPLLLEKNLIPEAEMTRLLYDKGYCYGTFGTGLELSDKGLAFSSPTTPTYKFSYTLLKKTTDSFDEYEHKRYWKDVYLGYRICSLWWQYNTSKFAQWLIALSEGKLSASYIPDDSYTDESVDWVKERQQEKDKNFAAYFNQEKEMQLMKLKRNGGLEKHFVPVENGGAIYQNNLGDVYYFGNGVERDYNKAFDIYEQAAMQGDMDAQYRLGDMYFNGEGVEQNYEKAFEWYKKSAALGNLFAQDLLRDTALMNSIGEKFYKGDGVVHDYGKAFQWYEKAAVQGDTEAQNKVGEMYYHGIGVMQDYKKAFELYQQSADQGNISAQYNLGQLFYKGDGIERDYEKAFLWYKKAAEQGDAEAQNKIGEMYCKGIGVRQDYEKALKWYTKSAKQGNVYAKKKCNNSSWLKSIGDKYYNGDCIEQDYNKAFLWYKKAAVQGDTEAQYKLGYMYQYGDGVGRDYENSFMWYNKSAEQGNASAKQKCRDTGWLKSVGEAYYKGEGVVQNFKLAFRWYEKAAEQGDVEAQNKVGDMYYHGEGVEKDCGKAFEWYEKSAEQKGADAQYKLGCMYQYGKGVERDYEKAFEWYSKSAKQRNISAQKMCNDIDWLRSVGDMYYKGNGVRQDYKKAFEWYEKAAEQGDAEAQNKLGEMYYHGEGVGCDYTEALKWYEMSARQGNINAQCNLGEMYYYGNGVKRDYNKAAEWYENAAAHGDVSAQNNLGAMYYYGDGMECDYNKAFRWYKESGLQGDPSACYMLGEMLYNGKGVDCNYNEAFEWYEKAAGHGKADAQYKLGYMYQYGKGVEQDYENAYIWYKKAAVKGNTAAQLWLKDADFMRTVGDKFRKGDGVEQDYSKAFEWYERSAEQGNADAQFKLGVMFYNGDGVKPDYKKACAWWEKSARQGNATAQYNLGNLYRNGKGVRQDDKTAFEWYKKSAEQGNAKAKYRLGLMYEHGHGVKQNYDKAFECYEKSAEQGNADAQYNLGVLYMRGDGVEQDYSKAFSSFEKSAKQGNAKAKYCLGLMYKNGIAVDKNEEKAMTLFAETENQLSQASISSLSKMFSMD